MSRSLKFRVWSFKTKKFIPMIEWLRQTNSADVIIGSDKNEKIFTLRGTAAWEIEQFTGVHDKDGKEIYEGDILWDTGEDHSTPRYSEVKWITTEGTSWGVDGWYGIPPDKKHREVVGNIYENPELVK